MRVAREYEAHCRGRAAYHANKAKAFIGLLREHGQGSVVDCGLALEKARDAGEAVIGCEEAAAKWAALER